jgi:predicted phosphodiesterase
VTIGILSDAHGNAEAFELARSLLEREGAETIYFLGDAVGYLPGTAALEAVDRAGIDCVRGNHEAMLLEPDRLPADDSAYRLRETASEMPDRLRHVIEGWPPTRTIEEPFGRLLLLHGSPTDPMFGYVYPDTDLEPFAELPELRGATVVMGNTHRPFVRVAGSTTFVNVGSCGLPRDVGTLGAACILDETTGAARIVRFDISKALRAALERVGPVHDLVHEVIGRTAVDYEGDLVSIDQS